MIEGRLTTHVLDTAHGEPGAGVEPRLYRRAGATYELLKSAVTNADGRCDEPLLSGAMMAAGAYRLVFAAGAYFRRRGTVVSNPPFVDDVTLDFGIADTQAHYHVPLLVSPWSYSTYRGS
jgi:5-hydroxyisourate hydrolase